MKVSPGIKYDWPEKELEFLTENFYSMTNKELAKALGMKLSMVRTKCYELGLKRMELEYWTDIQIKWLKVLYTFIGDMELALIFDEAYPKEKGWTLKHIEKKRMYLGLKRTKKQLEAIKERNKAFGSFRVGSKHTWQTRGAAERGTVRMWDGRPYVKTEEGFKPYLRELWEQHYGPIPEGMNIRVVNTSLPYAITNLEMITDAENARRNAQKSSKGLSDNYVAGVLSHGEPELRKLLKEDKQIIKLKRQQLLLNRTIYEQESNH
jgi:hypothetical protein